MYLVVDDDDIFRERLAQGLEDRGHQTKQADSFDVAVELASKLSFSRAILDLKMPGESGLTLIKQLKKLLPQIEIVMLTGYGSISTAVEAMNLGSLNYLTKPTEIDAILHAFEKDIPNREHINEAVSAPTLKDVEWDHIHRVLQGCDGNITKASKVLGIHRRSLQRKLNQ